MPGEYRNVPIPRKSGTYEMLSRYADHMARIENRASKPALHEAIRHAMLTVEEHRTAAGKPSIWSPPEHQEPAPPPAPGPDQPADENDSKVSAAPPDPAGPPTSASVQANDAPAPDASDHAARYAANEQREQEWHERLPDYMKQKLAELNNPSPQE